MDHPVVRPVLDWYAEHARALPWRDSADPWGVLVSEVMLQQTPVTRVLPAWYAWTDRWPTPADLAAARPDDVIRAWGSLGYPRRALRLRACAQVIVDRHRGEVPSTEAALRALPGVGEYTAAAVVAFAHRRRAVVLDTNVRRVLARALDGVALPPSHLTCTERDRATAVVPDDDARSARWNAAAMELGALVCTARAPRCPDCPLADRCTWLNTGSPPAPARRAQSWAGTDRQARGALLRLLRTRTGPVTGAELAEVWPDDEQRERALTSLVVDDLVARLDGDRYGLPR